MRPFTAAALYNEISLACMRAIVEFRNVSYTVGQRQILHELSLDVEEGETLVLIGRSGSGKTYGAARW